MKSLSILLPQDVFKSTENHILQQGMLIGKYQRKHK
ncbi:hypothetical protein J2Z76_000631 [Sedimentibacter acidaminivorans]|uniref:Uncharacterized protein n=1 Tax=Sedimentibacter acidaminivorans TaxID=913099 RepID=A0ABS4GAR6_9FIRM|nr:hypothetical protein [Sedimentibacter acidaminivorans]